MYGLWFRGFEVLGDFGLDPPRVWGAFVEGSGFKVQGSGFR